MGQHGPGDRLRDRCRPDFCHRLVFLHAIAQVHIHLLNEPAHRRGDLSQLVLVEGDLGQALHRIGYRTSRRQFSLDTDERR